MQHKPDILLVNVPISSLSYPPAATPLLKGSLADVGISSHILDLNLDLLTQTADDYSLYYDFFSEAVDLDFNQKEKLDAILDLWVEKILCVDAKWLGISVFTFQCQLATRMLLAKLKESLNCHGQIILGGAGISTNGIASPYNDFGAEMLGQDLCNYFIRGDGEKALVELLTGNEDYPGINNDNYKQLPLDNLPLPIYDDIINHNYQYQNGTTLLPVNGSRGCVRACTFCDIHTHWKKFTFRSGASIAKEIIHNYETYNVKHFTFTDSLINGGMSAFRELLNDLVSYYEKNNYPDAYFRFSGQFIVRNKRQQTEDDYTLMGRAGCYNMMIGVETGSDEVREHMRKKFTTDELRFVLDQFEKNGLNCYFSMIIGYPTETLFNHQETLNMFTEFQKYALNGTIIGINLGATLSVDEGTPLYMEMEDLGLEHLVDTTERVGINWKLLTNPDLTLEERVRRRIQVQEHITELGFTVWNGDSHLKRLLKNYESIKQGTY